MADSAEPYRLYDTQTKAFVSQKEYASQKTATQAAERRNQEYGAHRYSAEKYSDVVNRNTPKPSSSGGSRGGGGGGGGGGGFGAMGGVRPGMSPASDNLLNFSKGGPTASKRADGIAQRGKTRGMIR
jgi:hypothetical protein